MSDKLESQRRIRFHEGKSVFKSRIAERLALAIEIVWKVRYNVSRKLRTGIWRGDEPLLRRIALCVLRIDSKKGERMKLIHLSDLHQEKRVNEFSMLEDQWIEM